MPLACLDEVRDPRLFEEVLRFHYQYFRKNPDVAKNYVDALRAKVLRLGNDSLRKILKEIDSYEISEGKPLDTKEEYKLD